MAEPKKAKTQTPDLEAEQEEREEERRTAEQNEQQDLNQGMDTGTHDTTRSGVDWGKSYRTRTKNVKPEIDSNEQRKNVGSSSGKQTGEKK
jgi:hypothetical protein